MYLSIRRIPHLGQWLAGLSLSLGVLTVGTAAGWTSPYIAKLTAPDSTHTLKLTPSEVSWLISVFSLGSLIGAALSTVVQDFIGRKKTLLYSSGPLGIGWALILLAPPVSWLYISRVLFGVTVGTIATVGGLFMAEISDPMIRGSLITMVWNAISVGALLGTVMGGLIPLETFSYVCIVLTGLFVVSFVFIPESPYYHIANRDIQKAEKSLLFYKRSADVKHEICQMQDFIGSKSVSVAQRFAEFKKPVHWKNLLIVLCITVFLYCAGHHSINSYAEVILRKSKIDLTPSVVVMSLSFSAIVAGTVAMLLVDKLGRKIMLMISGFGLGVGHILLGSHFHMLSTGSDPKSISWLPVLSLFLVYFSIPCGLSTGPDTLVSELFPPILKAPMSFAFFAVGAIMHFAVAKLYQPYLDLVGDKYIYWTFAVSALCSVVFSYFCIPETARLSLIDVQENLKKDNNKMRVSSSEDIE